MGHRDRLWPSVRRRVHQIVAGGGFCLDRRREWRSGVAGALLPGLQDARVRKGPEKNIYVAAWTSAQGLINPYVKLFYDAERDALTQITKHQSAGLFVRPVALS